MSDLQTSLNTIVPSTYRGVDGIVECSAVKWEDIAGYNNVKEALKQVQFTVHGQFTMYNFYYLAILFTIVFWVFLGSRMAISVP
jgi:hypothetical protein